MKVLFILTEKTYNGADTVRVNGLAQALQNEGVQTDKIYIDEQGWIMRGAVARQFRILWKDLPWHQYDYFHCYSPIHGLMLSFRPHKGAKLVRDCHGLLFAEVQLRNPKGINKLRSPILCFLERKAAQRMDLCITVSKPLLNYLNRWRQYDGRVGLIRNGVDPEVFSPGCSSTEHETKQFRIGYAGGFQPWQALDLLVDTSHKLHQHPNIRWRIIGFGASDQAVKRKLATEMPKGTDLIDRCDRQVLRQLLLDCDLLVIPRKPSLACEVAFPTKFAEYLSMAKPVLVSAVDETAEIVKTTGCGFVAQPDPNSIVCAINNAADTPKATLEQMGNAGRDFVLQEFSWNVIGKAYKQFLESYL